MGWRRALALCMLLGVRHWFVILIATVAACGSDDTPTNVDDVDGDGWRACSEPVLPGACDCNDADRTISPSATETPAQCGNGVDEDCDGVDLCCDNDEDGYCDDVDCDDEDPEISPAAAEACTAPGEDAVDENCNGLIDEDPTCMPDDQDRDGTVACTVSPVSGCDCNDCDPGIRPGVAEVCGDGVDQDCDGSDLDCDPADMDSDGFIAGARDCNDAEPAVHAGAFEQCNSRDDDCDGTADEGCDMDADGDGWVEPAVCDSDAAVHPGQTETCDEVDNDCDGVINEVFEIPDEMHPDGTVGCVACPPGADMQWCVVDLGGGAASMTDPTLDFRNCGGCRIHCDPLGSDSCVDGSCRCSSAGADVSCAEEQRCCASGCEDLTSARNCGGCGHNCNADAVALRPHADTCADLDGDGVIAECACGTGSPCLANEMCCGGVCVTMNDDQNCGACGNVCYRGGDAARQRCLQFQPGAYRCECSPGRSNCNSMNADGCETEGDSCP